MSKFIKKILEIGFFVGTLSVQALADANGYQIAPETQDIINQALSKFPEEVKYIQGISELYQKVPELSEAEYNSLVQGATQNFIEFKEEMNAKLLSSQGIGEDYLNMQMYINAMNTLAEANLALKAMGLDHTAESLNYSRETNYELVGTTYEKEALVYDNDEWAKSLFWDSELGDLCFQQFEENYYLNGKTSGYFTGSFEYPIPDNLLTADTKTLDMAMQLHKVDYSVAYAPRSNDLADGFYIHLYISDRYDFILEQKLSGSYGHLTTTLANDTCAVYQECGYIHPFEIHVLYDF